MSKIALSKGFLKSETFVASMVDFEKSAQKTD
jgi:hypothetical protein